MAFPDGDVVHDVNLAYLDAELRVLRLRLDGEGGAEELRRGEAMLASLRSSAAVHGSDLRLQRIAAAFRLDEFERRTLVLAAAPELDDAFGGYIARAQGTDAGWPTVALAWRLFAPDVDAWAATRDSLRDDAPLFRFQLVHASGSGPSGSRTLIADRRIADALVGRDLPDARLAPFVRWARREDEETIDPAALDVSRCVMEHLRGKRSVPLVVHLHGAPEPDLELFAASALDGLGVPLLVAERLPFALAVPFVRESLLAPCAVLLSGVDVAEWGRVLAESGPVVFVASEHVQGRPPGVDPASWIALEVSRPDTHRRAAIWARALPRLGLDPSPAPLLARNFAFGACEIRGVIERASNAAWVLGRGPRLDDVIGACRGQAAHRMTDLAVQLDSTLTWDDLVVTPECASKLHELCQQVTAHARVLEDYGYARVLSRGRAVTALFAGPSGTGKTMAAEVIARELGRELYRVDVARLVSKYIGETEKNLQRIFAEAERARCVVLFDEADALFGRRTDVRDSHDRYANLEVSYLLQLVEEAECAVVLLATNRRDAIDEAFVRRFRFIVDFACPDGDLRRELWRRSFPESVPVRDLSFDVLAERLVLTGGNIKSIALGAAFLAAADGGVVTPALLARAARRELEKLGRPAAFVDGDLTRASDAT